MFSAGHTPWAALCRSGQASLARKVCRRLRLCPLSVLTGVQPSPLVTLQVTPTDAASFTFTSSSHHKQVPYNNNNNNSAIHY